MKGLVLAASAFALVFATTASHGAMNCKVGDHAAPPEKVPVNGVVEIALVSDKSYSNPFADVQVDVVVTRGDGAVQRVPAFWDGGGKWCFRYASSTIGPASWRTECSDRDNAKLHGVAGSFEVVSYAGDEPLYKHGPIRVAKDRRHFEHADGTPFFWLGDTWWKGLSKRISLDGFQRLAADRKAKGFSVVQIVAGPYPDEPPFDPRWANEGGMPYEKDYARINPAYFDQADKRIESLVASGLVPAVVGGWGWHLPAVGVEKMERHWRYLIARYGAYPVVWIVGGEAGGPEWTSVAQYLRATDPFHRPITSHSYSSGRSTFTDDGALDFDMLQTGHGSRFGAVYGDWGVAAANTVSKVTSHYSKTPAMPVLVGEVCYEGHMMTNGPEVQRQMFWSSILCGAAGHTYGAGGLWQMNSETERGAEYEFTPWEEAMHLPGSAQLGLGKKLLEEFSWWRMEPHPEWVDPHCSTLLDPHEQWTDDSAEYEKRGGKWDLPYAAGIPGELRIVYIPGHYYDWAAPTVKNLERDVVYHAFFFNPASGKRYGLGRIVYSGPAPKAFDPEAKPTVFRDAFEGSDSSAWKDCGTATRREGGRLVGGKGMLTVVQKFDEGDLTAGVDARSDAEAGIVLRYHDPDNYLVALYSPLLNAIYIHDRKDGVWGEQLGRVEVPGIGPSIRISAAAHGDSAAMILTDGSKTYATPVVQVGNTAPGKAGLWLYQVGDRQEYADFRLARAPAAPVRRELPGLPAFPTSSEAKDLPLVMHENPNITPAVRIPAITFLSTPDYRPARLPAPQDWVLVLERIKA